MHLLLVDTDQELAPLHTIRYDSGASLYLLLRNTKNFVYLLPECGIKQKIGLTFPFKNVRIIQMRTVVDHRFDFYIFEWIESLQQFKERIFF